MNSNIIQYIMDATIQQIYQLLPQLHRQFLPYPPPQFQQILSSIQTPQVQVITTSYSQFQMQIQMQLERRIINVSKIKEIGSALYSRLGQDIVLLNQNIKKIDHYHILEAKLQQESNKMQEISIKLVKQYCMQVQDVQIVPIHLSQAKFSSFLQNSLIPYCMQVHKSIIPAIKSILSQAQMRIPSQILQLNSTDNYEQYPFQQHIAALIEVLTKFRSLLSVEYQALSNEGSGAITREEQYKNAVVFLTKIRNLFAEVKFALCDKNCTLQKIYLAMNAKKQKLINTVRTVYNNIKSKSLKTLDNSIQPFIKDYFEQCKNRASKEQSPKNNNEQNGNNKLPSYIAPLWPIDSFYQQCYNQVVVYIFMTVQFVSKLQHLQKQQSEAAVQIQRHFISPAEINTVQNKIVLPLLKNINQAMGMFSNIKIKYLQNVQFSIDQVICKLIEMQESLHCIQLFISRYSLIWVKYIRRVKQIQKFQSTRKNIQIENAIKMCIQLNEIIQVFKKMKVFILKEKTLDHWRTLDLQLNNKIQQCRDIRLIASKAIEQSNAQLKHSPSHSQNLIKQQKLQRGSQILIELDNSDQQIGEENKPQSTQFQKSTQNLSTGKDSRLIKKVDSSMKINYKQVKIEEIAEFLQQSSELFQNQLKDVINNGFELAIFHLEKGHLSNSEFKIAKLKGHLDKLLGAANFNKQELRKLDNSFVKTDQSHQNLFQPQPTLISQSYPLSQNITDKASRSSLVFQVEATRHNLEVLSKLIRMFAVSPLLSQSSIISLAEQSTSFQYQDWSIRITKFEQALKIFDEIAKNASMLSNLNTGALFSVIYRVTKDYASVIQIACDMLHQILFVFKSVKQLDKERKGNLAKISINMFLEQDLDYILKIISFKVKVKDEIMQLEKFNNLSKQTKTYLKSVYTRFMQDFEHYIHYSQEILSEISKKMQVVIGFKQNNHQIFEVLDETIDKLNPSKVTRLQMEQVQQITQQILEVHKELKDIGKFAKPGWPINETSLSQIRKILLTHQDQFHLTAAVHELVSNPSKVQDTKFSDPKIQKIYNKVVSCCRALKN